MKVIAAGTLKGGTGKSMTVFQLCGLLAKTKKVLAIDADPQCNLTTNCGVDNTDLERPSIKTIFEDKTIKPQDVIMNSPIESLPNLHLIPSNIRLTETELNLAARSNREGLLRNWIQDNLDNLLEYDYIFCDTNPSMGLVNQNVFCCADSILLVTDVDFNSIQGAQMFTYLWEKRRDDLRIDDNVRALIVNNYDARINLSADLISYIEDNDELGQLYAPPAIRNRVALKNSVGDAVPVAVSDPDSETCAEYGKLLETLKGRGIL